MHSFLIFFHSIFRWIILLVMLFGVYSILNSRFESGKFNKLDEKLRKYIMMLAHIQLIVGIGLYAISPDVSYFWSNFKTSVHTKALRYFAMEHAFLMLLSILIITAGAIVTKRQKTDEGKIKIQLIWLVLALLVIFLSIPWPFLPFSIPRPYFRGF